MTIDMPMRATSKEVRRGLNSPAHNSRPAINRPCVHFEPMEHRHCQEYIRGLS